MPDWVDLVNQRAGQQKYTADDFLRDVMSREAQMSVEQTPTPDVVDAVRERESLYLSDIVDERIASGTVELPEADFKTRWSKMPWYYRAARYPLGLLDIAQLPGDLIRSITYDVSAREKGQPLETLRLLSWQNLSRYAPWGDTPKHLAAGRDIAESWGVPEEYSGYVGTALEIMLDPFILLDGVAAAGSRVLAREASKITTRKLGREVFTADEMIKAAKELEEIGDKEVGSLMRLAAKQRAVGKLYSPYEWVPESVRKSAAKGVAWALDKIPSPFTAELAPSRGVTQRERLSILEAFINPQVGKAAKLQGTPHEEAIRKIYGSADVTLISRGREGELTPSSLSLARNRAEEIAMEIVSASADTAKIFEKYTGLKPDQAEDVFTQFSKWSVEWLDKLDADKNISKALMVSDKPIRTTRDLKRLYESSRFAEELYDRVRVFAAERGLDAKKLFEGVKANSVRQLQNALRVGWVLSGMPDYYRTIDKMVEDGIAKPFEISSALWKKASGNPLNKKEEELYNSFREYWRDNGGMYASIDPLTYIKNVSEGYFRRAMGINMLNEKQVKRFVEDLASGAKWYPASKLGADEFLSAAEKYLSPEDTNRLAAFLYAYGDGPVTPRMLEEKLGIPAEKIAAAANDANIEDLGRTYLDKLQRDLQHISGKRPSAGLFGRSAFRRRVVDEEDIDYFLPLLQTEERAAALAVAAYRSISGQELLRAVGDALDEAGLIFTKPYDPVNLTDAWGEKLMYIPEEDIFGPLAGKYVPRYAGMTLMKAVQTGDPGMYSMLLNKLRKGWLSSPNTISRNIAGGLMMMRAVGIPYSEQAKYLKEAYRDVRKMYEEGNPRTLGPGSEYLNLYETGTLAREAYDSIEQALDRMVAAAVAKDKGKWAETISDLDRKVDKLIEGGPLFGWFQLSEDTMRVATFKWVRDRLVRRGYSQEEAGKAAAAAANNILFDYADQPPAIEWFRKTGLMLFPSFFGFNVGRTANLILKRPAAMQFPARLADASTNLLNDDERRLSTEAAQYAWWGSEVPIMLPIPGSDDRFWVIPLRNIVPHLQGLDWQGQISEPILGGIAQRLIDAWYAHTSGEGVGPISQRYGQRVYTPGAPTSVRTYETLRYLVEGYVPGWARTTKQTVDALIKTYRAPYADRLMQTMGKEYGFNEEFLVRKIGGMPVYEKSIGGMLRDIGIGKYLDQKELQDLQKRWRLALQAGDAEEAQRLMRYYRELLGKRMEQERYDRGY